MSNIILLNILGRSVLTQTTLWFISYHCHIIDLIHLWGILDKFWTFYNITLAETLLNSI